ncbi:LEM-3-like GIY-YIG domain-containing protein [Fusibacter ferrireducens]|uniref:GIY-YIG domain-containing protein n=1 Tax=Fusibacter ferrireducens TaxID=2785058 RepID=A0ABS0A0A3_9FIRM|nr:hypothetical protein [Fusibacter ferrireducens]MBF4696081.1 hypothetical protein [Fusibacter ferrireducens]
MSNDILFSQEVIDEIKYYVYRLIDPRNGETFYVGKGKGNRLFYHIKGAKEIEELDDVSDKIQVIRDIISKGLEVIHVVHRHGMDEKEAFEVEAALIDAYPGATNIMNGAGSNDRGTMNVKEIIEKYSAEEANFEHRVLMITINKSITEREIYEASRYAWKLSKTKAKRAEYVVAVKQGLIVGVFKPIKWLEANTENFPGTAIDRPGRYGFVGEPAEEKIQLLYLRKRIPDKYRKKGSANPIKYSFK